MHPLLPAQPLSMKHENDKKTIKLKNIRSTLDDEIRRRKETEDTVRQYDNQFAMIRKLLSSRDRMSLLNEEERSLFNFQQQGSESVGYDQTHSTLAYPPPLTPNQQDIATVTAPLVHTHTHLLLLCFSSVEWYSMSVVVNWAHTHICNNELPSAVFSCSSSGLWDSEVDVCEDDAVRH